MDQEQLALEVVKQKLEEFSVFSEKAVVSVWSRNFLFIETVFVWLKYSATEEMHIKGLIR